MPVAPLGDACKLWQHLWPTLDHPSPPTGPEQPGVAQQEQASVAVQVLPPLVCVFFPTWSVMLTLK